MTSRSHKCADRGNRFAGDAWRNRLAAAIGTQKQYRTVVLLQTLFGGNATLLYPNRPNEITYTKPSASCSVSL